MALDGEYHDVAQRSLDFVSDNIQNVETDNIEYANFSYHRACYSALTNTICIKHARERCQNRNNEDKASSSVADVSERESEEAQPAKMLRSTLSKLGAATTSMRVGSRNPHVCIICKSEKFYFTETISFLFCTVFDHIFVALIALL